MDCTDLSPYDQSQAIPLSIVVWKSAESKEHVVFDNILLYPDDSISNLLLKVKEALNLDTIPYAWFENEKPVLFDVVTSWPGYNPNPFFAKTNSLDIQQHKPSFVFRDKQVLSTMTHRVVKQKGAQSKLRPIQVVQIENLPSDLRDNSHYVVSNFNLTRQLSRQEDMLKQWWNLPKALANTQGCIAHYVEYSGKIKGPMIWNDLFETFHTSPEIPFIQWIHDTYRIMYKVHDRHQIPASMLDQWTSYDRIAYQQRSKASACVFYALTIHAKTALYVRCYVTEQGDVQIIYKPGASDNIPYSVIRDHCKSLTLALGSMLKRKINVSMTNITLRATIPQSIPNYTHFVNAIYKAIPIFHVEKTDGKVLDIVYKRASNYRSHVDIPQYIRAQLSRGVLEDDIKQALLDAGVNQNDVLTFMEEANTFDDEPEQKSRKGRFGKDGNNLKIKTILKVSQSLVGVDVLVSNAPNVSEARNALHWLQCMIVDAKQNPLMKPPKTASSSSSSNRSGPSQLPVVPATSPSSSNRSGPSKLPDAAEKSSSASPSWSVSSSSSSGGGPRLGQLQKADNKLFGKELTNKKLFANSCQPSGAHPMVVTRNHFEENIKPSRLQHLNNYMEYGSDKNNVNVYMCPMRWCPISQIPVGENEKCPQDGEEPEVHTENRLNIGFLNNIRTKDDDRCVPCCYTRPLKADLEKKCTAHLQEAKKTVALAKDQSGPSKPSQKQKSATPAPQSPPQATASIAQGDTYILTRPAPIDPERYGTIPQAIHERVFGTDYALCTSANYTQQSECLLRKGIHHHNDSLMNAICFLMGFKKKSELIHKIKKELTPMKYLTLENGRVAAAFIPDDQIMYDKHQDKTREWLETDTSYCKLFDAKKDMNRQVLLYVSRKNYIHYLTSDEPKSPHHVMSLMKQLGYLLVLWEKETSDAVSITCPFYQTVEELYLNMSQHVKFVMVLKDGAYYEPLELKSRSAKGVTSIPPTRMTEIIKLLKTCKPTDDNVPKLVEMLHGVKNWWNLYDKGPQKDMHSFDRLILSPELRISHLLTKSNILITLPNDGLPLTTLPIVIEKLDIKKVHHHEDIVGQTLALEFLYDGVSPLLIKLMKTGIHDFKLSSKPIEAPLGGTIWKGSIVIPPLTKLPILLQPLHNPEYDEMLKTDRKWFSLQMYVAKRLWFDYERLVVPVLDKPRKEQLTILSQQLDLGNETIERKLRIAIEETPYSAGKEELWKYLRNLGARSRFPFFQSIPIHDKKHREWIFSQLAVEERLPDAIMQPPLGSRPNARFMPTETSLEETQMHLAEIGSLDSLPTVMLSSENAIPTSLPSKWTVKNTDNHWQYFTVFEWRNYTQTTIPTLLQWIASKLKIHLNLSDIVGFRTKFINKLLTTARNAPSEDNNTKLLIKILDDPSLLRAWNTVLHKTYTTSKKMWENSLSSMSFENRHEKWTTIINNVNYVNMYYANIDMLHAASLLDCTFFIILHRAVDREQSELIEELPAEKPRGSTTDRITSSMIFAPKYDWEYVKTKPIVFLYSTPLEEGGKKKGLSYHPMIYKNNTMIFSRLGDAPQDIQHMVNAHIQHIQPYTE